jgi:hypothetical protein
MAEYGGLWHEKPLEALEMHRKLIEAPAFAMIRKLYVRRPRDFPPLPLAGWNWNDRKGVMKTWKTFLARLENGTNLVTSIEARLLRTATLTSDQAIYAHIRDLLETIATNSTALIQHPAPLNYNYHVSDLFELDSHILTAEKEELSQKYYKVHQDQLRKITDEQREHADRLKNHKEVTALLPAQREFLESKSTDLSKLFNLFPHKPFPKAHAETLLPLIDAYLVGLSNSLATLPPSDSGRARGALVRVSSIKSRIEKDLGIPQPAPRPASTNQNPVVRTNRPGPPFFSGPSGPGSRFGQQEVFIPTTVMTNTVTFKNYHPIPTNFLSTTGKKNFEIASFHPEKGKLWLRLGFTEWLEWPENRNQISQSLILFPQGESPEKPIFIESAGTGRNFGMRKETMSLNDFQFLKESIYLVNQEGFYRYDLKTKAWSTLPIPLPPKTKLYAIHENLYALTPESLLEIRDQGSSALTLVSTRRDPPVTALDTNATLEAGFLLPSSAGFRIWIPNTLYQYSGKEFSVVQTFTPPGIASARGDSFFYFETANRNQENIIHQLLGTESVSTPLLTQAPQAMRPLHHSTPRFRSKPVSTTWIGMDQFEFSPGTAFQVGDDLILFGSPLPKINSQGSVHPGFDLKPHLFVFNKKRGLPVVLKLDHSPSIPPLFSGASANRTSPFGRNLTFVTATDTDLVLGNSSVPGLWFLPLVEIQKTADNSRKLELPTPEPGSTSPGQP